MLVASAVALALLSAGWGSASAAARLRPATAAAWGARDLWVLGGGELLRSTDAGRHFAPVSAPPLPSEGPVPSLVFANARDGYGYVPDGGPLYVTHDGGRSWRRAGLSGDVFAFAVGGGDAYVVAGHALERSPVGRDAWQKLRLPFSVGGGPSDLAARGPHLWVVGTGPLQKTPRHSKLGRSDDRGLHFAVEESPCFPGLPGGVDPATPDVLWATCSTGMMGQAFHSTDGGRRWRDLRTQPLTNAAAIVPFSGRVAALDRVVQAPLLRTTNGGRTWRRVRQPGRVDGTLWIARATSRVGEALVETGRNDVQLWRTADAGAVWRVVPMRG